jgi:hypothetical protein
VAQFSTSALLPRPTICVWEFSGRESSNNIVRLALVTT